MHIEVVVVHNDSVPLGRHFLRCMVVNYLSICIAETFILYSTGLDSFSISISSKRICFTNVQKMFGWLSDWTLFPVFLESC